MPSFSSSGPSPPQSPTRQFTVRPTSQHAPMTPSRLREAMVISPEDITIESTSPEANNHPADHPSSSSDLPPKSSQAQSPVVQPIASEEGPDVQGTIAEPTEEQIDSRTHLLEAYHRDRICGSRNCNHGTFSPRVPSMRSSRSSISSLDGLGGPDSGSIGEDGGSVDRTRRIF